MSSLLLPVVWAVILTGQLVVWSVALRGDRIDQMARRKFVGLRQTAETVDGWAVAAVLGPALLVSAAALAAQGRSLAGPYVGVGLLLLVEAWLTRRTSSRVLRALAGRGRIELPDDVLRREPRRRRTGLVALVAFSVVTLFPAFEDLPAPAFLAFLVVWAVALPTMFVAGVVHLVGAYRLYEARRRISNDLLRRGEPS